MSKQEQTMALLSKLTQVAKCANSAHVNHFYDEPYLALCGHRMCNSCWKIKKKCSICEKPSSPLDLLEDTDMKKLTKLVKNNVQLFEKLYTTQDVEIKGSPTKDSLGHVKNWLGSSQNNFSIPPTQVLDPILDVVNSGTVHSKFVLKSISQEGFDNIECIEESQAVLPRENDINNKQREIEKFSFDEVSKENNSLRRSSRRGLNESKKIQKSSNIMLTEVVIEEKNPKKNSETPLSVAKSGNKEPTVSKHWNNVKKIKKEFSRLNKRNVKKLNVSIEMCKKTKTSMSKSNVDIDSGVFKDSPYVIEENTPFRENQLFTSPISEKLGQPFDSMEKNINITKGSSKMKSIIEKCNVNSETEEITEDTNTKYPKQHDLSLCSRALQLGNPPSSIHFQENHLTYVTEELLKEDKCTINNATQAIACKKTSEIGYVGCKSQDSDLPAVLIGKTLLGENSNDDPNLPASSVPNQTILHEVTEPDIVQENKQSIVKRNFSNKRKPFNKLSMKQRNLINSIIFSNRINQRRNISKLKRKPMKKIGILNVTTPEGTFIITGENICVMKPNAIHCEKSTQTEIGEHLLLSEITNQIMDDNIATADQKIKVTNAALSSIPSVVPHNNNGILLSHMENPIVKTSETLQCTSIKANTASEDTVTGSFKMSESVEKETSNEIICAEDLDIFNIDSAMSQNVSQRSKLRSKRLRQKSDEVSNGTCKKKKVDNDPQISHGMYPIQESHVEILNSKAQKKQLTCSKMTITNTLTNDFDEITSKAFAQIDADLFEQRNVKNPPAANRDDQPKLPTIVNLDTSNVNIDGNEDSLNSYSTPITTQNKVYNVDSDSSFVDETPQKEKSSVISAKSVTKDGPSQSSGEDTLREIVAEIRKDNESNTVDKSIETPLTLTSFSKKIINKSTPLRTMPRRSLDFSKTSADTIASNMDSCQFQDSATSDLVKTTLEREFMERAFDKTTHNNPTRNQISLRKESPHRRVLAFSCLASADEKRTVMAFAKKHNWDFSETYTPKVTHLIVGVDDKKAHRTVKYICALAAGKWIVSFDWIAQCIRANNIVDETPFEVLDMSGCNGPRLSRTATAKLFEDIVFYCHPPFSMFESQTLEDILISAGGKVVKTIEEVSLKNTSNVALVLAEPESTLDQNHICLAMHKSVVPVNYEWVLNSLGSYSLESLLPMLLCPSSLVPFARLQWPHQLLVDVDDSNEIETQ